MTMRYEFDTDNLAGSGSIAHGIAGENLGENKVVYMGANGRLYLADADSVATMPCIGITLMIATVGQGVEVLLHGYIGDSTWTWTTGSEVYVSTTAGELTQTAPSGAGDIVQVVGMATSSTFIYFNSGVGDSGEECLILEGATAFVGQDPCKDVYTNYWYADGAADDVQIQAALTYTSGLGGGLVFIERGTYDMTAAVDVAADVKLQGCGVDTVLRLTNNFTPGASGDGAPVHLTGAKAEVCHLTIDGNNGNQTYDGTRNNWIGVLAESDDVKIYHVYLHHVTAGAAIHLDTYSYCEVLDCTIEDCGKSVPAEPCDGIYNGNGSTSNLIRGNYIDTVSDTGAVLDRADYCIINGNTMNTCANQGVAVGGTATGNEVTNNIILNSNVGIKVEEISSTMPSDNLLSNNTIQGTTGIGIRVIASTATVRGINTIGNTLIGCGTQGIYYTGVSGQYITHSIISDNYIYNSTQHGIAVEYLRYSLIENNEIYDVGPAGLYIANSSYNDFGYNFLDTCTNNNIQVVATSDENKFEGNQIYNSTAWDVIIAAGNTGNIFRNNKFTGAGAGIFSDSGTDTIVPEIFVNTIDPLTTLSDHPVVTLADGVTTNVYNSINLPLEFQELVSAHVIVCQTATAGPPNMRWQLDTDFGKICADENYNQHSDSIGATDTAVDLNQMECLDISAALTGIAAGDLIGFNFARLGAHANDTVNADCYYMGIRLRYV